MGEHQNRHVSYEMILLHGHMLTTSRGNSTIAKELSEVHGLKAHYNALSKTAKIAVAVAAISATAISVALLAFCCIKNRRAGRRERAAADAEYDRHLTELKQYKQMLVSEEEIHPRAGHGPRSGYI